MSSKPFFFRITAADLLDFATDPEGEGVTLLRFAKDLQKGESSIAFIQSVIDEASEFSNKKRAAGKSGGQKKASRTNPPDKYGKNRSERMAHARSIATHTKEEWEAMKAVFGFKCVICGCEIEDNTPTKDHVIPVSCGGSDGIDNIQPSCRACNVGKGTNSQDFRIAGWKQTLSKHLANTYPLTEAVTVSITEPLTVTEEEPKIKTPCAFGNARRAEMFQEFWDSFEYKKGKGGAEKSWKTIKLTETIFQAILTGAKREAKNRDALIAKGSTPKMAQGWLTEKRWEDEHEEAGNKAGADHTETRKMLGLDK